MQEGLTKVFWKGELLLGRFIANLFEKIIPFTPILKLKDESEFTWGAKQQEAFEKIKEYLSTPPVLHAPRRGVPFKLYIVAEEKIIGDVLTQEDEGKEYVIAYLGHRLFYPETRYAHIQNYAYHCTMLVLR